MMTLLFVCFARVLCIYSAFVLQYSKFIVEQHHMVQDHVFKYINPDGV